MFDLTGKKALVTGASGGIGGAIVRKLAEQGAEVTITGRNGAALEKLASEIGGSVHIVVGALDSIDAITDIVKAAEDKMGNIDILVNNAGMTRDGLAIRMKEEDWDNVINVNLSSSFKLSKAVMRSMMKKKWGRMIHITSVVGVTGNPGQANYVASKAGMVGMSKALAAELASRNITSNCVAPGFIETAMTDALTDAQKEQILSTIPMGKMGDPDDIAAAVVYLASDEAAYVTGQTLHVNGGMAMI